MHLAYFILDNILNQQPEYNILMETLKVLHHNYILDKGFHLKQNIFQDILWIIRDKENFQYIIDNLENKQISILKEPY